MSLESKMRLASHDAQPQAEAQSLMTSVTVFLMVKPDESVAETTMET